MPSFINSPVIKPIKKTTSTSISQVTKPAPIGAVEASAPHISADSIQMSSAVQQQPLPPPQNKVVLDSVNLQSDVITGIDVTRPDIIMVMDHQPGYVDGKRTPIADLVDLHSGVRRLNRDVMNSVITALRTNVLLSQKLDSLNGEFLNELSLAENAIDNAKSFIDKRDFLADALSFREKHRLGVFGFSSQNYGRYSDTKLFLQLCHEIVVGFKTHTPGFFAVSQERLNDVDPTAINNHPRVDLVEELKKQRQKFPGNFVSNQSVSVTPSSITSQTSLKSPTSSPSSISNFLGSKTNAASNVQTSGTGTSTFYSAALKIMPEDQHRRLRLMLLLFSRETIMSAALADTAILDKINKFQQLADPVDSIIGIVPTNILVPPSLDTKRLSMFPFLVENERLVMFTEIRWLVDDTGSANNIPGIEFISEPLIKGATPNKATCLSRLAIAQERATIISDAASAIYSAFGVKPIKPKGTIREQESMSLILEDLKGEFIKNVGTLLVAALMSNSSSDSQLRDLLFRIFMPEFDEKERRVIGLTQGEGDELGGFTDDFTITSEKTVLLDTLATRVIGSNKTPATSSATFSLVTRDKLKALLSSTLDNGFLKAMFKSYGWILEHFNTNNLTDSTTGKTRWRALTEKDLYFIVFEIYTALAKTLIGASAVRTTNKYGVSIQFNSALVDNLSPVITGIMNGLPFKAGPAVDKSTAALFLTTASELILDKNSLESERTAMYASWLSLDGYSKDLKAAIDNFKIGIDQAINALGYFSNSTALLVLNRQQNILMRKSVDAAKKNYAVDSPESPPSFFEVIAPSRRVHSSIHALLRDKTFGGDSDETKNIRLIAVGLPAGFTSHLKERAGTKASLKSTFLKKQSDVVRIQLWKRDLEYELIRFRPLEWLFEISRFVSHLEMLDNESRDANPDIVKTTPLDTVMDKIRTLDYSSTYDLNILGSNSLGEPKGLNELDREEYGFLSINQKQELRKNHVIDFLLKQLVGLITGINLDESRFPGTQDTTGLASTLSKDKEVAALMIAALKNVGVDETKVAFAELFSNNVAAGKLAVKKLAQPKLFDRTLMFNADLDSFTVIPPNELGDDTDAVSQFNELFSTGIIVVDNSLSSEIPTYKLSRAAKNNATFERLFVTVSTFDSEILI